VSSVFGIEVTSQGGEAGQVGEEGGDGLALAVGGAASFQRRLLGQNALG
jgi:hypothetical protein